MIARKIKPTEGPSKKYVTQLGGEVTDLLRSLRIILHETLEFCDEGGGRRLKIGQNCVMFFMDGPQGRREIAKT
jgi:hypothetical protein